MEGFLSFLLFGGLFFLMMRYGCGAHVMHGGHGGKAGVGGTNHVDPVCGMSVAEDTGYGKMHEGRLYRFCSRTCLDKFETDPPRYTAAIQLEGKS